MALHVRRILIGLGALILLVIVAILASRSWTSSPTSNDAVLVYRAVCAIRSAEYKLGYENADKDATKGFWTGDVSELYRLGLIPKDIAEADVSPLRPLIDRPRPYRGYYFVAMKSGQGAYPIRDLVPLAGSVRNEEGYGICAYPSGGVKENRRPYLLGPRGVYRGASGCGRTITWPDDREFQDYWAIVD